MSDLRMVIFLKFVRFGANFGLLFIFAMSVLPNRYFENKDDSLHVRGNMRSLFVIIYLCIQSALMFLFVLVKMFFSKKCSLCIG